jgi:hypothetical protein
MELFTELLFCNLMCRDRFNMPSRQLPLSSIATWGFGLLVAIGQLIGWFTELAH